MNKKKRESILSFQALLTFIDLREFSWLIWYVFLTKNCTNNSVAFATAHTASPDTFPTSLLNYPGKMKKNK